MRRHVALAVVVLVSLGVWFGCSAPSSMNVTAPTIVAGLDGAAGAASLGAEVNQQLARLRAAVAPYHNLQKALDDGFAQITQCVSLPGVGAMGYHYAQLPFDGEAEYLSPEALVYAPQAGRTMLAAVEYIIPQPLWTSSEPPSLFGQDFHKNDVLGIWALHVWLFKHNPAGIFEDWNPTVTCPS